MKCIAIDDEPRALEIIETFSAKVDFLDFVARFRNPLTAIDYLTKNEVDLIFLDINMPELSGTEFVKVLKNKPMVIFTTAYSEYAIESYELDAVDYLLKPFEFERFLKSVLKAKENLELRSKAKTTNTVEVKPVDNILHIKSKREIYRVKISEVTYIEGLGNYVMIHLTSGEKLTVYTSMKELLLCLPSQEFFRIHKSYIVAINNITSFEYHQIKIGDATLPVGKNYRKDFQTLMGQVNH